MSLTRNQKYYISWSLLWIFVIILIVGFIYALVNLFNYREQQANESCAQIARLAGKEYLVDDWNCYILNGNKIERIK